MVGNFYKKYIRIPPNKSIDIRDIMPIINHSLFQRLLHISQLGTTLMVFPGASHNRFEHALGVYDKTVRFSKKMVEEGFLTEHEAKNVSLFGLMHDIGHGPFSHVLEELTPVNHDINGMKIVDQLGPEIKKAGGDFKFIKRIFIRKNPLYRIVMDKNVGMDKLDYLDRDVYHTGFGQRPDVESLFNYLIYLKGKLVIDKKSLEAAKQMQKLYLYMYKEVYLHKSALISQRFLQKMVSRFLKLKHINPGDIWLLNDYELLGKVSVSENKELQFLHKCYKTRNLPRTGMVIRLKNKEFKERIAGKEIKVIGENHIFFQKFMKHTSPEDLEKLESMVGRSIGVPAYKIVIVPTLTPWRFVPEDILYHDNGRILSTKATQKEYFEGLKAEMNDYMAVRICIIGNRNILYKNSGKIYQLIKKELA